MVTSKTAVQEKLGALAADPQTIQCPFDFYREAQEAGASVFKMPGSNIYVAVGFDEIKEALAKPAIYSSDTRRLFSLSPELDDVVLPAPTLVLSDGLAHTRSRNLVNKLFTISRVNAMEGYIQQIVDELIDAFIDRGEIEMFKDFACPLPVFIIADQLGVPRDRISRFREWTDALTLSVNNPSAADQGKIRELIVELNDYMLDLRRDRRTNPRADIISILATTPMEGDETDSGSGEARLMTDAEFVSSVQQILTGGNETTTAATMSTMLLLIRNPAAMEAARQADPQALKMVIEESLRLEAPVQGFVRVTTQETVLGGVTLPKDAQLMLRYGAGNRDRHHFGEEAEKVNLCRNGTGGHFTFGGGVHNCVGQILARMELFCAFRALLSRLKNIRLTPGRETITYAPIFTARQLKTLHITFDKA